jgi:hypothetical protein
MPEKGSDCDTIRAFFNEIRPCGRRQGWGSVFYAVISLYKQKLVVAI